MKRGDPLKRTPLARKTPLQPRSSLQPGTGLTRSSALPRTSPLKARQEPRPRKPLSSARLKVTAEERRAKRLVKARSGGACEGCDRSRAVHWAHRIAEGQGGPWCPSNGLHLCVQCHLVFAHANPTAAKALGWIVHPGHDHTAIPVRHALHGLVLLDCDGGFTFYCQEAA